jgi:hypothetical protein
MNTCIIFSATSIIAIITGSWLVAYEDMNKYLGPSHQVSTGWGSDRVTEKTGTIIKWEVSRNEFMRLGPSFISLGSGLQLLRLYWSNGCVAH